MTTLEEYQWQINLVKDRYQNLNLTSEQAEKIYKYEQDKNIYSEKHKFSAWEEWDYELTTFKEILDPEQFKNYENSLKENIRHYEESLTELDNQQDKEIAYCEEQINFYETQFLPELFKAPFVRHGLLFIDKPKIEYLRTEYKRFLNDRKMEILTSHFRHNKTFKPKELKAALLRHRLSGIFPDYSFFKHQMDKPTKAIAHFLNSKYRYLPDNIEELLARKFGELKDFNEGLSKKYYPETGGWRIVVGKMTDEEEKECRRMTLLLLDKEKYGC